jgi:hypothetical protein
MLKRSLIHCGLAAMLLVTASCLFDPDEAPPKDDGGDSGAVQKMELTTREAVLNNIEYAYDNRKIDAYDELLDQNFTFFFAPGDVGGSIPEQWPRTDELLTAGYLFISNNQPVPAGPVCRDIRLNLTLDNIQWVEIIPEGFPDETWYTTTIFYNFTFEMDPDQTYVATPGAKAQYTVRNMGTEAAPHWQLVEWRDLGSDV